MSRHKNKSIKIYGKNYITNGYTSRSTITNHELNKDDKYSGIDKLVLYVGDSTDEKDHIHSISTHTEVYRQNLGYRLYNLRIFKRRYGIGTNYYVRYQ